MKLFLIAAVYFVFCFSPIFGSDRTLQERVKTANSGDYVVVEANKLISLVALRSVTPHTLILEEISLPANAKRPSSWSEWLQKRAPGHTSWTMIEIDLNTHEVLECYSFSRASWTWT